MAHYYNDSDSDSSFDDEDGEEYSNIDFGVHSLVPFEHTSVYGTGRRVRGKEQVEALYELVEPHDDDSFYNKVQAPCIL